MIKHLITSALLLFSASSIMAKQNQRYIYWLDNATMPVTGTYTGSSFAASLDLAALTPGTHTLTFMFSDEHGNWTSPQTSLIVKEAVRESGIITAYKYWFNDSVDKCTTERVDTQENPFVLNGTFVMPPEQVLKPNGAATVIANDNGSSAIAFPQTVSFRCVDSKGQWSETQTFDFNIETNDPHIDLSHYVKNRDAAGNGGWSASGRGEFTTETKGHYSGEEKPYFSVGKASVSKTPNVKKQTINGMPPGTYTVTVTSRSPLMTQAALRVNDMSVDLPANGMTGGAIWSNAPDSTTERKANNGKGFGWETTAVNVSTAGEPIEIALEVKATGKEHWLDFTDVTLAANQISSLVVKLGTDIDPKSLPGSSIQITSPLSSISLPLSSRSDYTFAGVPLGTSISAKLINNYGQTLWSKQDFQIDEKQSSIIIDQILPLCNLDLRVLDSKAKELNGIAVKWFDRNGTLLTHGQRLTGMAKGSQLFYTIELPDSLIGVYSTPKRTPVTISTTDQALDLTLSPLSKRTLSGRIVSETYPVPMASLAVTSRIGGRLAPSLVTTADERGCFSIDVPDDSCTLTVSRYGYKNASFTIDHPAEMGDISIATLTGCKVNLKLHSIPLSSGTQRADTTLWMGSDADMEIEVTQCDHRRFQQ